MKSLMLVVASALAAAALSTAGCGCRGSKGGVKNPEPDATAASVLARLAADHDARVAYQAESVMDYWTGKDKVKGTVLLMGKRGARVRLNALNPNGGSVAADLACDGVEFKYVDSNNNCQLSGLCNRDSIAQLLRVSLDPDDFLLLVLGSTPLIEADAGGGTVSWDAKAGHQVVVIASVDDGLRQTITFDGKEGHFDVVESVVTNARGEVQWKLENKGFRDVTAEDGATLRLPAKTRFRQPTEDADLLVEWKERRANPDLDHDKFVMTLPGVPTCGQQQP